MRNLRMILLVSGFVFTAVGCATGSEQLRLPRIEALVDQAVDLEDLMDLHARATAVAVVQPTGRVRIEEFTPAKGVQATPFPIVELEVIDVIKGSLPDVIELREGYTYFDETGRETPVVSGPARFLLYLEPYSLGDGSAWNGQWVTTAWLSGVYMDLGRDSGVFTRVDPERTELPRELTVTLARDPGSARPEVPSP